MHHRVKNNLQVISSMIHLRSKRAPEEMQPQFDALAQRIHAMGRVYEQIHGVDDMSEIDLSHYLRQIADLVRTDHISVEVNAVPVTVAIDTAIPLGLVAIELITNAVKHAFSDSGGTVRVLCAGSMVTMWSCWSPMMEPASFPSAQLQDPLACRSCKDW